jgi:RNA polymerase sigma-70 factor (ECF subfamily)
LKAPLEEAAAATDSRLRPDLGQDAKELRDCVRQAIARLAPKAAEIFVLRYFEDHDNQEIARLLGTSVSDVSVSLHRSRTRVQQDILRFLGDKYEHR